MLKETETQMAYAGRWLADLGAQRLVFSNLLSAAPAPSASFNGRSSLASRLIGSFNLLVRRVRQPR
jgi:hypothetical protein